MKRIREILEENYRSLMRQRRWWRCLQLVFAGLIISYWAASSMLEYFTSTRILRAHAGQIERVFDTVSAIAVLLLPVFGYLLYRKSYVWEGRREDKEQAEYAAQVWQTDAGMIWNGAARETLMECEALRGDGVAVQRLLMKRVQDGEIERGCAEALMNAYHKLSKPESYEMLMAMRSAAQEQTKPVFDRKWLDEMKWALSCMTQADIDRIWDEHILSVAKKTQDTDKMEMDEIRRMTDDSLWME